MLLPRRHRDLDLTMTTSALPLFYYLTPTATAKVFDDYVNEMDKSSTLLTSLPTPVFWYGLVVGQEFSICPADPADLLLKDGGDGATEVKIRLERVGPAKKGGMRTVSFTVGGAVQNVEIKDSVSGNDFDGPMAAAGNALEVGCCFCSRGSDVRRWCDTRRSNLLYRSPLLLIRNKRVPTMLSVSNRFRP